MWPQVTARGFAPLLQFAYTAKLLLSRDNIQEVIRCAQFLRVHNLEDSCFRFLEAQLRSEVDGKVGAGSARSAGAGSAALTNDDSEDESMQPEAEQPEASPRTSQRHPEDERLAAGGRLAGGGLVPGGLLGAEGGLDSDGLGASADQPKCPKYRKYQWACNKHNNHSSNSSDSSSTSGFPSTAADGGVARGGPPLAHIKVEEGEEGEEGQGEGPYLSGDEQDQVGPAPMETEPPRTKRTKSPSCLRAFFRSGAELPALANRLLLLPPTAALPLADAGHSQGDQQTDLRGFGGDPDPSVPSTRDLDGFPAGLGLRAAAAAAAACNSICKQEAELDRRSVIFSSCSRLGPPAHSYPGGGGANSLEAEIVEHMSKAVWAGASQSLPSSQTSYPSPGGGGGGSTPLEQQPPPPPTLCRPRPNTSCPVPIKVCPRSPPCEARTRTSSSCSSYSYAEDGSGSPSSLPPQFEFSSSPRCLNTQDAQDAQSVADALFGQVVVGVGGVGGPPKIKCEQSYGTNSSDESGSFSEGDSVQERGPEVSAFFTSMWPLLVLHQNKKFSHFFVFFEFNNCKNG